MGVTAQSRRDNDVDPPPFSDHGLHRVGLSLPKPWRPRTCGPALRSMQYSGLPLSLTCRQSQHYQIPYCLGGVVLCPPWPPEFRPLRLRPPRSGAGVWLKPPTAESEWAFSGRSRRNPDRIRTMLGPDSSGWTCDDTRSARIWLIRAWACTQHSSRTPIDPTSTRRGSVRRQLYGANMRCGRAGADKKHVSLSAVSSDKEGRKELSEAWVV